MFFQTDENLELGKDVITIGGGGLMFKSHVHTPSLLSPTEVSARCWKGGVEYS